MIGSDAHCPYHDPEMVKRMIDTAKRLGIRRLLFAGDWMDCEPKSKFDFGGDQFTTMQEINLTREFIRELEKHFDEILLLRGNHEERIVKYLKSIRKKFERDPDLAEYASIFIGGNTIEEPWRTYADYFTTDRTMVSNYPVVMVDDKFMVVHPSAYSKLGGRTPMDLCGIYLTHVVSTHNHIVGMMPHASGQFYGFDIGGLFDPKKCFYKNMRITRHPQWNQGFGWIKDGRFGQFVNHPDLWDTNVN